MKITFDPVKRDWTLQHRKVDFVDAEKVFSGPTFSEVDRRHDYGEERIVTVGRLDGRMVIVVWTPRDNARHVISMRKANDREKTRYGNRLEEA